MAFQNLDLEEAFCFAWCPKSQTSCWYNLAVASVSKGWDKVDVARIDVDLKTNVDACYFFLCQGTFRDLDTGMRWHAEFVNDHEMWRLSLPDGRGAETLPEDAAAFFKSEYFRKFSKRCGDLVARGVDGYEKIVKQHLEDGELLQVDPIKLERVLDVAQSARAMDALRNGKYELQ